MINWLNNLSKRAKKMSTGEVIWLAAMISIVTFVGWISLAIIVWGIFQLIGVRFNLWDMLEAVSTALAVAQFLGGGIMALVQLTESVDNRNLSIYNDVFDKMSSDEAIEARRWIYLNLPPNPEEGLSKLDPVGQAHVKHTLNTFDHLGFLLEQDWVTAEPVIHWVSPMVVKVWEKLGPYIEYEVQRRREPDYYQSARELAHRCGEWRRTRIPDSQIVWVDNAL